MLTFPILYGITKTGKIKQWKIEVTEYSLYSAIIITHGQVGGKQQTLRKTINSGKNLNKINSTTHYEQAINEAQSMWNKKKKDNYFEKISQIDKTYSPMLALDLNKNKNKIIYPAFCQPKLNGVRCLTTKTNNRIKFMSRGNKEFTTLNHLIKSIRSYFPDDIIIDGELYKHGWSFQKIISNVKKEQYNSKELQYCIYDIVFLNNIKLSFENRWKKLQEIFNNIKSNILILTPTFEINSFDDIILFHDKFVKNNYEGCIVRNKKEPYMFNYRSSGLLKYKKFEDSEFKIIGGKEGTGLDKGCVIFKVKTDTEAEFYVRPKGTVKYRKELFNSLENYIGRYITIQYQGKSEDGIPIFPVGIAIRDYE